VELIPAGLFMVVLVVTAEDMVVVAMVAAVVVDAVNAELSYIFIKTICPYIKIFL